EGGDGSGKGTQAERLRQYIADELGKKVTKLSFPRYGQSSAYYVEQYLNGKYGGINDVHPDLGVLAFAIDRYAQKSELVEILSDPDHIVLADRYEGSNLAHQGSKIDDSKT